MCVVAQSCPGKPVICMRASQRMQHSPYLQAIYNRAEIQVHMGFPGSSAGKELACNAGDLGLIPGLGRPPGEGKRVLDSFKCFSCVNCNDHMVLTLYSINMVTYTDFYILRQTYIPGVNSS